MATGGMGYRCRADRLCSCVEQPCGHEDICPVRKPHSRPSIFRRFGTGPWGRGGELVGAVGSKGMAGMFAYSKIRDKFDGRSFEGETIGQRLEANKFMYYAELTVKQLLSGKIPPLPEPSLSCGLSVQSNSMYSQEYPSMVLEVENYKKRASYSAYGIMSFSFHRSCFCVFLAKLDTLSIMPFSSALNFSIALSK